MHLLYYIWFFTSVHGPHFGFQVMSSGTVHLNGDAHVVAPMHGPLAPARFCKVLPSAYSIPIASVLGHVCCRSARWLHANMLATDLCSSSCPISAAISLGTIRHRSCLS